MITTREEQIKYAGEIISYGCSDELEAALKKDFPELRESEDERIRKVLLKLVSNDKAAGYTSYYEENGITCDDAIAYLEKQKEQKPILSDRDSTDFEIEVHEIIAQARSDSRLNDADVLKQFEEEAAFALMLKANKLIEQKPAEWSEEDEKRLRQVILDTECIQAGYEEKKKQHPTDFNEGLIQDCKDQISWLKSLPNRIKKNDEDVAKLYSNKWNEEEAKRAAEDYADEFPGMTHENDGSTIEDYDKPYNDFLAGVLWAKHHGIFQNGNTHWKPSEEQMEKLKELCGYISGISNYWKNFLNSLSNDLKKLKEG